MKSLQTKALILSCGTGEGHNSAAEAVAEQLKSVGAECEIRDVLSFRSEKAVRRASSVYGAVIRRAPLLFGLIYKLGGLYDRLNLPSPIYSANAVYADKLYEYIKAGEFTRVVCTHLFAMEAMTAVRRKYFMTAKCYGVLTDYTAIPFYKDTDLDGYLVPDEATGVQLKNKGIPERRIFVTGIPVHPKFNLPVQKIQAREKLGISEAVSVIIVMSGGAGCGKLIKLCKALEKKLSGAVVYVLTGRNLKLKSKIDARFAGSNITAVAFTKDVHLYIKSADVLITKAGGLSSTEAAVSNVPLVHLKAIPGVETANLKFFSSYGLSLRADTVKKAVRSAEYLISDASCAQNMKKLQKRFINGDAVRLAGEIIREGKSNECSAVACVYNGGISVGKHNVLSDCSEAVNA